MFTLEKYTSTGITPTDLANYPQMKKRGIDA